MKEKGNFWLYLGLAVVLMLGSVLLVKNAEHDKYAASAKAIAEDSLAYRNDAIHSGGARK